MAENQDMKAIMTAFVALVLFIAFTTVIADNEVANTELSTFTNESVTLTGGSGDLSNTNIASLTFFGNASNNTQINSNLLTFGEHVNFSANGTINIVRNLNVSGAGSTGPSTTQAVFAPNGVYNVSGTYEGALYVDDAPSRSLLSLTTLFWVILGLAIGLIAFMATSGRMNFGFGNN